LRGMRGQKKRGEAPCARLRTGSDHGGRCFAANKGEALCLVKWCANAIRPTAAAPRQSLSPPPGGRRALPRPRAPAATAWGRQSRALSFL
jgi:hypothetical protein